MDALAAASRRVPRRTLGSILPGGCFPARIATRLALAPLLAGAVAAAGATSDVASEFPTAFARPQGIVAGPDGNLWFAEEDGNRVTRLSPSGTVVGSTSLSPGGAPQGVVVGPDQNVWVTEPGVDKIARLDGKSGALLGEFPAPGAPENVAAGPDGKIWFTENGGDRIGRMDVSGGNLAEFPLDTGSHPNGIVAGPCGDGRLWFTEEDGAKVAAMDVSGAVTATADTGSGSMLRGIAAGTGGDCNLYYANRGHNTIGRVSLAGVVTDGFVPLAPGSTPIGIVVSAQGDLWFTLNGANAVGRVPAAAGTPLTTYTVQTAAAFPDGIGLGPPGAATIYFTESGGHRVGYVNAGGTSTSPDLAVSKTVEVSGDPLNQTFLYTLTYSNLGAQASDDVVVDEHVPLLTTFQVSSNSAGWICDPPTPYAAIVGGGTCHLNLGPLGAGASGTTTFGVETGQTEAPVPPDFSFYNLTSISGSGLDSNPGNNVYDLATPDTACAGTLDPIQYLLCLANPDATPTTWIGRVMAKAAAVVQQLRIYFQLRDSVFLTSPGGRRYFDTYRAHSAELRTLLGNDATLRNLGVAVVGAWRAPLQTLLDHGAVPVLSQGMYASMTAFLDRLRILATPDFRSVLNFPRFQSLVGLPLDRYVLTLDKAPCTPSDASLCLHGGRFRVEARWRDQNGNTGTGHGVVLTDDSGYFWFFTSTNVEVLVKALDGCGVDGKFWVFAGGLTNVQLTLSVTDTATGQVKEYTNPEGTAFEAILDTSAFSTCAAAAAPPSSGRADVAAEEPPDVPLPSLASSAPDTTASCAPSPTTLCLDGSRIRVEANYIPQTGASGLGQAVTLTPDTGYFWFFSPDNVEVIVKVLEGCGINSHRWVFAAGLTNVDVEITARDGITGEQKKYVNPLGTQFKPVQDTSAFNCR